MKVDRRPSNDVKSFMVSEVGCILDQSLTEKPSEIESRKRYTAEIKSHSVESTRMCPVKELAEDLGRNFGDSGRSRD